MSGSCIRVPGRSRRDIRKLAELVRSTLKIEDPHFPIEKVLEWAVPTIWDDYVFAVKDKATMGPDHGRTFPDEHRIEIRDDVYLRACAGEGRDRFTLAHEFGHLLMHRGVLSLGRTNQEKKEDVPAYADSEWQANTFAAELLMPVTAVRAATSAYDLAGTCGVSDAAAALRIELLTKNGDR